ncbi:hypothetical protein ACFVTJ_04080 [Agrobacterium sp. NPDC058088]|uniref:hypothetical protein n=1 Tax=Agrobacterium sp. NPDC058088 TaxID=3346335 RepID=UPI0036DA73C9
MIAATESLQARRAALEAKIEELIALLDLLDGDENLEPYLADSDPEDADREEDDDPEPEETDQNGDEQDCCHSEDEWRPFSGELQFDGSGTSIARRMVCEQRRRQA